MGKLATITDIAEILFGDRGRTEYRRAQRLTQHAHRSIGPTGFPEAHKPYLWLRDEVIQWGEEQGYLDPETGMPVIVDGRAGARCANCRKKIRDVL